MHVYIHVCAWECAHLCIVYAPTCAQTPHIQTQINKVSAQVSLERQPWVVKALNWESENLTGSIFWMNSFPYLLCHHGQVTDPFLTSVSSSMKWGNNPRLIVVRIKWDMMWGQFVSQTHCRNTWVLSWFGAKWKVIHDRVTHFSTCVHFSTGSSPWNPKAGRIRKVCQYPGAYSFLVGVRVLPLASGEAPGAGWDSVAALFQPSGPLRLALVLREKKLAEGSRARFSRQSPRCCLLSLQLGGTCHLLATHS